MKNKTEIRYWLKDGDNEIDILATETSRVPEVGEVISFGHHWNEERANRAYSHLDDSLKKTFFPKPETLLDDDYVVVSVKRYISVDYVRTKVSEVFSGALGFSNSTSMVVPDVPIANNKEQFEVFIKPFQHSELTETPIAKVRNLLSPVLGSIKMIELIKQNPGREQEIIELLKSSLDVANENIEKLLKIVKDDKNWK